MWKYFKLSLFDLTEFVVRYIKGLQHRVRKFEFVVKTKFIFAGFDLIVYLIFQFSQLFSQLAKLDKLI